MRVELQLFAVARERAGRPVVTLDLPEPATVADLKAALARSVPALAPLLPTIRIAVDSEYRDDAHPVAAESELAAIPPVSGGSVGAGGWERA